MELRSLKASHSEDSEGPVHAKEIMKTCKKLSPSLLWVIGILVGLFIYNCYGAYQEQIIFQNEEKEEAMNCMYQFKS